MMRDNSFLYEFAKIPMRRRNELNFLALEPTLWSPVYHVPCFGPNRVTLPCLFIVRTILTIPTALMLQ